MTDKHKALTDRALWWLYDRGCSVYAKEVPTRNGIADALGIMTRQGQEKVYYIEAKASRSDLICEKQKTVYERSVNGHLKKRCEYHTTAFKDLWGEAERFKWDYKEGDGQYKDGFNEALQTIIDRYQSELDQPNK